MGDISKVLLAIREGQADATEQLLPFIYEELRALARRQLSDERLDHTLQPTALVHEAYLRLIGANEEQSWQSRGHFFAAAAKSMRRILIDSARAKNAKKRNSGGQRVEINFSDLGIPEAPERLVSLDEAMKKLAEQDARAHQVVELRFFGGLTLKQVAQAMDISTATAERDWAYARLWLREEISQPE